MLKRCERYMKVFAPSDTDEGDMLGYFPLAVSHRTSEEVESHDMIYTNLRLSLFGDRHRSPSGGYTRGMIIESQDGRERYRVLVPVLTGRTWVMKAERVMMNGDVGSKEGVH